MVANMASLVSTVAAVVGAAFGFGLVMGAWARQTPADKATTRRITQILSPIFFGISSFISANVP